MSYRFVKGHGTENDFVVVPGEVELSVERVRALCDRRAGIGADGVLGVVRAESGWFMDYRNSDGSISEMCGNGVRVFARYLADHEGESFPFAVHTRDGVKVVHDAGAGLLTVEMGSPEVLGMTEVGSAGRRWEAKHISMGNPHAVAFVDDLRDAGDLLREPDFDAAIYPDGVNVEFVVRRGEQHVAMRVHERGAGETRSCGTGACAVMVATAVDDGAPRDTPYVVDVPGGRLEIVWTAAGQILMTGPAVLVAQGETNL